MKKIILAFGLFGTTSICFAQDQILNFEFSALAGSEITALSSANDADLNVSTISRGVGLTASGNSGRFNATNWALTSIENAISENKYMEFSITPKAGFQFKIDSVFVNIQRSSTGPSAFVLRNSIDSYAANLDQQYAIADVNSITEPFTIRFTQSNSAATVTYRFYMFAESGAGSGGFEGSGDDIIVYGEVTSTGVVNPEPTNHVTGFSSPAQTFSSIELSFESATGANLPDGYLLLGKTGEGSYADVADGSPVLNDNDWSDGNFALNLSYSTGTIEETIEPLSAITSYSFVVYSYSNSGENIDFKTEGTLPSVSVSTEAVILPFTEEFTSSLGSWKQYSVAGVTDVWRLITSEAGVNGFGDEDDEDWLISPPINFDNHSGESLVFKYRDRFEGEDMTIEVSSDYVDGTDPTSANWTNVPITLINGSTTSTYSSWTVSETLDLSFFSGAAVFIAFKYVGTASTAEEWNVDSIVVNGSYTVPVELASFNATSFADGAKLTWSTKTEQNNYGFEIERRAVTLSSSSERDAIRSAAWKTIGFVAGKGTTNDPQSYSFVDSKVSGTVSYRLKQVDFDGAFEYSNEVEFVGTPGKFEVLGNYPNPFNPSTVIRYQLSEISDVNVSVYNILGQKVVELVNEKQLAGAQSVEFNATGFASGLYIYKVKAGANTVTRTLMLTK